MANVNQAYMDVLKMDASTDMFYLSSLPCAGLVYVILSFICVLIVWRYRCLWNRVMWDIIISSYSPHPYGILIKSATAQITY